MTRDEKCAKWRKLHPGRAADLRAVVAQMVGTPVNRLASATVEAMLVPTENRLLCVVYGLSDDAPATGGREP